MVLTIGDFAVSGIDEGYEATRTRGRSGYEVPIVDAAFQGAAAAGDAAYVPYSSPARRGEAVGIATVVDTVLDDCALICGSYYARRPCYGGGYGRIADAAANIDAGRRILFYGGESGYSGHVGTRSPVGRIAAAVNVNGAVAFNVGKYCICRLGVGETYAGHGHTAVPAVRLCAY